jgi:hypothetical protein
MPIRLLAAIVFFHVAINICMTIGLAPVIGITLPLNELWRLFPAHFYDPTFYPDQVGCRQADGAPVE